MSRSDSAATDTPLAETHELHQCPTFTSDASDATDSDGDDSLRKPGVKHATVTNAHVHGFIKPPPNRLGIISAVEVEHDLEPTLNGRARDTSDVQADLEQTSPSQSVTMPDEHQRRKQQTTTSIPTTNVSVQYTARPPRQQISFVPPKSAESTPQQSILGSSSSRRSRVRSMEGNGRDRLVDNHPLPQLRLFKLGFHLGKEVLRSLSHREAKAIAARVAAVPDAEHEETQDGFKAALQQGFDTRKDEAATAQLRQFLAIASRQLPAIVPGNHPPACGQFELPHMNREEGEIDAMNGQTADLRPQRPDARPSHATSRNLDSSLHPEGHRAGNHPFARQYSRRIWQPEYEHNHQQPQQLTQQHSRVVTVVPAQPQLHTQGRHQPNQPRPEGPTGLQQQGPLSSDPPNNQRGTHLSKKQRKALARAARLREASLRTARSAQQQQVVPSPQMPVHKEPVPLPQMTAEQKLASSLDAIQSASRKPKQAVPPALPSQSMHVRGQGNNSAQTKGAGRGRGGPQQPNPKKAKLGKAAASNGTHGNGNNNHMTAPAGVSSVPAGLFCALGKAGPSSVKTAAKTQAPALSGKHTPIQFCL